jgi:hypothetical protein
MCGEGQVGNQHCKHLLRRERQTLGAEEFLLHSKSRKKLRITERLGSNSTTFLLNLNLGTVIGSPKISAWSLDQSTL